MKTYHLVFLLVAALLGSGCKDKGADWDASGVFEATEVVVSARATGELLAFSADEGRQVQAGEALGCVDTLQLALQKRQLAATCGPPVAGCSTQTVSWPRSAKR